MASSCSVESSEQLVLLSDVMSSEKLEIERKEKLNETPELREESLKQLRALIKDQKLACMTNDSYLLLFLRTRKFDVQRSFKLLQTYVSRRVEYNEHISQIQLDIMRTIIRQNFVGFLPYRDSMGRIISYRRLGIWNTDISTFEETLVTSLIIGSYIAYDPMSQINGAVVILEFHGNPLAEILIHLRNIRYWISLAFFGMPVRYAQVHIVDLSRPIRWAYEVVKPFLPEKIRKRVVFHDKKEETLLDYLSPDILPSEFGGNCGPLSCDHVLKIVEEQFVKLKEEQCYLVKGKSS